MPTEPDNLDSIAAGVVTLYRDAETHLIQLLTNRLNRGLDEPDWAIRRLNDLGQIRRQAQVVTALLTERTPPRVTTAITEAYRTGRTDALDDLATLYAPSTRAARDARIRTRISTSTVIALARALEAELGPARRRILPAVTSVYRRAIAQASARAIAGRIPIRQAAQAAWSGLVAQGITGFTDSAGRRWRLHTYVEMATDTAVHRAVVTGQADTIRADGHRLAYVPDRPGECPLCRPYEGRVLALDGPAGLAHEIAPDGVTRVPVFVTATEEAARAAGLFHPRCSHELRLFVPGVSRPRPATAADPTGYAARQRQRQIERRLRDWREQHAAALTDFARTMARDKIGRWDREMTRHLAAHPTLTRRRHREQIGAGFSAPATAAGIRTAA